MFSFMQDLKHDHRTNVDDRERRASMAIGVVPLLMAMIGMMRRGRMGLGGLLLGVIGGELVHRGYTGRCMVYRALGIDHGQRQVTGAQEPAPVSRDVVDEASWESFPASDAPARSSQT